MKPTQTRNVRTWYGISLTLRFYGTHWVSIGPMPPHPQLVNMLLRIGLTEEDSIHLQTVHELGHLQTFPIPLVGGILLVLLSNSFWLALLVFFLLSEFLSEAYVIFREGRNYFRIYGIVRD